MRELAVTLEYERGVDPVTDVFIEHPDLVAVSVDISVGAGGLTRVDRVSGPPAALEAFESVYLDPTVCNECTAPSTDCDADRAYEVVDRSREGATVYAHHESVSYCDSVPYHAAANLPPGTLFDSTRRGGRHEWRLLMRSDRRVGDLYGALVADLPPGVSVSFERLVAPDRWGESTGTLADLSPEQRATIEAAVEMDYYDTPRGATLGDLAATLGVPQSTFRYRLRRAEAGLVRSLVPDPTATAGPGEAASPADD
jgi:predicted DNA binding protein